MLNRYTREDCETFRMLCTGNAARIATDGRPVILMLSGGMDSLTILYAFIAADAKIECVNFDFEGITSEDTPSAQRVCESEGIPLKRLTIPEPTWDDIRQSARDCLRYFDRVRRVKCESSYAFRYVAERLPDTCIVLHGNNGDSLFGYHKSQAVEAARLGDAHPDVIKRRYGEQVKTEFRLLGEKGQRTQVGFYFDKDICDFCMRFTANALNWKFPKSMMYYAFEDYHKKNGSYRKPRSYIKAGGEDSMFERKSKQLGYASALEMFKEAARS